MSNLRADIRGPSLQHLANDERNTGLHREAMASAPPGAQTLDLGLDFRAVL
jgi:hypothetical protein